MTLFRRSPSVSCFYCLSTIDRYAASSSRSAPFDPSSFRCPYCACWNRYDSRGQIIGDEPAMHDERMNADSFSKRGVPDRNHLPSLSAAQSSPFCRICQTNQTLLINLRAVYLPEPSDPSYATRLAQLPAYIASLQSRYPPVCPSCQPAVDAEIARKDEFARTRALAGALKATSRPPSRAGKATASTKSRNTTLQTWRIRGVLWTASYVTAISCNAAAMFDLSPPSYLQRLTPLLTFVILISVTWAFWDPTYSLQQKSQSQGRKIRVGGREKFIFFQSLAWLSRLATSLLLLLSWLRLDWDFLHLHTPGSLNGIFRKQTYFGAALVVEISALVLSYFAITIRRPVPIRLIDTSAHRALSQPSKHTASSPSESSVPQANPGAIQPEPEFFSALSLSSNPIITPMNVNPMFGQSSLAPASSGQGHGQGQMSSYSPSVNEDSADGCASAYSQDDDEYEDDLSSLRSPLRGRLGGRHRDPDAMDWEPSTPAKQAQIAQRLKMRGGSTSHSVNNSSRAKTKTEDDGTWLRQQRFFPPEEPTGLEGLFMRTRLIDEDVPNSNTGAAHPAAATSDGSGFGNKRKKSRSEWGWGWVYGASVLPVVAVLVGLWLRSR